jgi:type I restriction enzyme S subunit
MKHYDSYKDSGIEWIGEIPSHWSIPLLNYLISGIKDGTHGTHERVVDGELLLSSKNVTDNGLLISDNESRISLIEHGQITKNGYPQKGDVLITIVGSIGRSCVYEYDTPISFQRSVCFVRTHDTCYPYYLKYYFESNSSQYQLLLNTKTSTQGGIYINDLKRLQIPLPPLSEQEHIVSYLDEKTTKIDELIQKKLRKIDLLKEYRTSLINTVVTKGLNPNVPMKDSGIEWIGEIPSHWEVTRLKRMTKVKRGSSPRPIDNPKYFDENGQFSWVRISDVTKSERYLISTEEKLSELGCSLSTKVYPNQLFLSIAGSVGKPIISKIECCIHDGFVWFDNLNFNPELLWYQFNVGTCFSGLGKMGTQLNLNSDTVGMIHFPIPPLSEQEQIVSYLDDITSQIDKTIDIENEKIELLKEYRQSLISNVVTGKIKVIE